MATLTITRGLPGSGKSTWAREQPGAVRLNRDEFRRMLHGAAIRENWAERHVTIAQRAAAGALLRAGVDVVCDDTNLRARVVRDFAELAFECGASFAVKDFTDVPLDVCIARDAGRDGPDHVGEEVIRSMHQRYLAGRALPAPVLAVHADAPEDRRNVTEVKVTGVDASTVEGATSAKSHGDQAVYRPGLGLPEAILVDIDGTVALMGDRSPHDMTRIANDKPHEAVIIAVRAMHAAGHRIVFCSGRTENGREDTQRWLARHVGVPYQALFMRKVGDQRKDSVVKAEIFEREIRSRWRITAVFDDRNQVVRMWRSLGLTVFQVADGNF